MCRFAVFLAESISWGTIRSYISALRFYQISVGLPDPSIASFPRLTYLLKGIRKHSPDHVRSRRLPITPDILRSVHTVWSQGSMTFNKVMLWAACCLGFFGFMRAGEFTRSSAQTPPDHLLMVGDITVDSRSNPQMLVVLLRHSKTDPFSAGISLYLGRTGNILCPVSAVLGYLAIRPPSVGFPLVSVANLARTTPGTVPFLCPAIATVTVKLCPGKGALSTSILLHMGI